MDKAISRLTVFFEEPFWVGIFECISEGKALRMQGYVWCGTERL